MSVELEVYEGNEQVAGVLVDNDSVTFWSDHEYLDEFLQTVQTDGLPRVEENEDSEGRLSMRDVSLKITDKTVLALITNLEEKDFKVVSIPAVKGE